MLTEEAGSTYADAMTEPSDLTNEGASSDPAIGLRAAAAMRRLAEQLEDLQVRTARTQGWSWADIASALGISKQAVHRKYAARQSDNERIL